MPWSEYVLLDKGEGDLRDFVLLHNLLITLQYLTIFCKSYGMNVTQKGIIDQQFLIYFYCCLLMNLAIIISNSSWNKYFSKKNSTFKTQPTIKTINIWSFFFYSAIHQLHITIVNIYFLWYLMVQLNTWRRACARLDFIRVITMHVTLQFICL